MIDSGEMPEAGDQWWKIGYVKSDASPIKSEVGTAITMNELPC